MLSLPGSVRIFLARCAVDLRKSHDGLCSVVRQEFREDPLCGHLFVFTNRRRDRIKLLIFDRNGFWLFYKRLERGTFQLDLPAGTSRIEITRAELAVILEGIDLRHGKIREGFATPLRLQTRDSLEHTTLRTS